MTKSAQVNVLTVSIMYSGKLPTRLFRLMRLLFIFYPLLACKYCASLGPLAALDQKKKSVGW